MIVSWYIHNLRRFGIPLVLRRRRIAFLICCLGALLYLEQMPKQEESAVVVTEKATQTTSFIRKEKPKVEEEKPNIKVKELAKKEEPEETKELETETIRIVKVEVVEQEEEEPEETKEPETETIGIVKVEVVEQEEEVTEKEQPAKKTKYMPRLDSTLRWTYGDKLGVQGSLIGVVPVYGDEKNAFFIQPELIFWEGITNQRRIDASIGLVYRRLIDKGLVAGINTFYDYDFKRGHRRITAGADLQSEIMHASVNYYHPLTSWRKGRVDYEEKAQKGVEANAGVAVSKLYVTGKVGIWESEDGWDPSYGIQGTYEVTPGVFIEAEYEENESVGPKWSTGLALRYSLPDFEGATQNNAIGIDDLFEPIRRESRIIYREQKFELKPFAPETEEVCPPESEEQLINGETKCVVTLPPTEVCEEGELIDGKCIVNPEISCPEGSTLEGDKCIIEANPECPPGSTRDGNDCIIIDIKCPEGSTLDGNGNCVLSPICPENSKQTTEGKCVIITPICPEGSEKDENNNCIITTPVCPEGSKSDGRGNCILKPQCPPSSTADGEGNCIRITPPVCPEGTRKDGNDCVIIDTRCPEGSELSGDACVITTTPECPEGSVRNAQGVCVTTTPPECPGESKPDGRGGCVSILPPTEVCEAELNADGECVTPITPTPVCKRGELVEGRCEIPITEVCEDESLTPNADGVCVKVIPPTEVCANGKPPVDGKCPNIIDPEINCPAGSTKDDMGRCVLPPVCADGSSPVAGKCVVNPTVICREGVLNQGKCVLTIPPTKRCANGGQPDENDMCIVEIPITEVCEDGTRPNEEGICPINIIDVPRCPPNSVPTGRERQCRCDRGFRVSDAGDACLEIPIIPPVGDCSVDFYYKGEEIARTSGGEIRFPSQIVDPKGTPITREGFGYHQANSVSADGGEFTPTEIGFTFGYRRRGCPDIRIYVTAEDSLGRPLNNRDVICQACGIGGGPATITGIQYWSRMGILVRGADGPEGIERVRLNIYAVNDNGPDYFLNTMTWFIEASQT